MGPQQGTWCHTGASLAALPNVAMPVVTYALRDEGGPPGQWWLVSDRRYFTLFDVPNKRLLAKPVIYGKLRMLISTAI